MYACMDACKHLCLWILYGCMSVHTYMDGHSHTFWEANHSPDQPGENKDVSPSEEMLTGQPLIRFICLPLWVCAVLRRPEQGAQCPGTRVIGSWELQALLTTEEFLHPQLGGSWPLLYSALFLSGSPFPSSCFYPFLLSSAHSLIQQMFIERWLFQVGCCGLGWLWWIQPLLSEAWLPSPEDKH